MSKRKASSMAVKTAVEQPSNNGAQTIRLPTKRSRPLPLYETSSQFRNWRYSPSQLDKMREALNSSAIERIATKIQQERSANSITSEEPVEDRPYLTPSDELLLINYYLSQLPNLSKAFFGNTPNENLVATSQTYLKRFYLSNTVMDYHPKYVMLTCFFLACKTENRMIPIDHFSNKIKENSNSILELEFVISQSLKFEYKVHHATSALQGLLLDLQTTPVPLESIETLCPIASKHLHSSKLTDLEFIYSPSQIALACIGLPDRLALDTWLRSKISKKEFNSSSSDHHVSIEDEIEGEGEEERELEKKELMKVLDRIGDVIRGVEQEGIDKDKVKEIDRRLKFVSNPEKDPNSALYKQKMQELSKEKEAKAKAKAASKPPNNDSSVFD